MNQNFADKGYLVLPGFYDVGSEIVPIQEGVRAVVDLVASKYGVEVPCSAPLEAMVQGYSALIALNRSWGAEIYDAVKQIPAFMRLVSNPRNEEVFRTLRPHSIPGLAAGGYGIRIDNPGEEKFHAQWHQEFPAQLRSPDGIVFWTPLLQVTAEMGPVQIAVGSQREGIIPVYEDDKGAGATGAYRLHMKGADERIAKYPILAPLTNPGDLILLDFLTLHQSGYNVSRHPRWSIQFRYFNFTEPLGIRIGWKGSFAAGVKYSDVLPELVAQE